MILEGLNMKERLSVLLLLALTIFSITYSGRCVAAEGDDLVKVFQRSLNGAPLRAVAIGGSITQGGDGWIRGWLKKSFPNSHTVLKNSGLSGTGSMLGVFRVGRDVINFQPDLVLIEWAVNDSSTKDADTVWALESIIHRLKKLPNPPAIFFIESAAKNGSMRYRHHAVARHYGFGEVDLQKGMNKYLKDNKLEWGKMFSDAVHPNKEGHEVYASLIGAELDKYLAKAKSGYKPAKYVLPKQKSSRALVLDGMLMPFPKMDKWKTVNHLDKWWTREFLSFKTPRSYPAKLSIPVQGSVIGIFYSLSKKLDYGKMLANVDGNSLTEIPCNHRGGFSFTILKNDMKNKQHMLNLAVPQSLKGKAGPMLGYILVGGFSKPGADSYTLTKQGRFSATVLSKINIKPIPAKEWVWTGPYGDTSKKYNDKLARKNLQTVFDVESKILCGEFDGWKPANASGEFVDLKKLTGFEDKGVCYSKAVISSDAKTDALFGLCVDYWAKVWINGKLVKTVDTGHGSVKSRIIFTATLNKGENTIIVKTHSGSKGNEFALNYSFTD